MLGDRNLNLKAVALDKAVTECLQTDNLKKVHFSSWLQVAYQQGKQISQIIAYIWRWSDENDPEFEEKKKNAQKLKEYFVQPTHQSRNTGENLAKLFGADARNPNSSEEAQLLYDVFFEDPSLNDKKLIFPIFDDLELGKIKPELGYIFELDIDTFQGSVLDAPVNNPQLLRWVIPYPPRPQLTETTITKDDLEDWIINRVSDQYFPDNYYLPASTC